MAGGGRRGSSFLKKTYLLVYNVVQTAGWSHLFYLMASHYLDNSSSSKIGLYEKVWWNLMVFQNAAVLEIFHAATGIIPSNALITLMQVSSRVFLVCGILEATKSALASIGLPLALLAWSITEIIRYGYYTFSLLGFVPKFLVFLRYTLFIVLYPIGVTGELLCLFNAQKEIGESGKWSTSLPNNYNFIFNYQYLIITVMMSYIPYFPMLYGHMFSQRKKILGGNSTVKQSSKKNK